MSTSFPMEISCQQVKALLDADGPLILVDCREPDEHRMVSLDGAKLLPTSLLPAAIAELEPLRDERIVVFCHHGMCSLRMVEWLREHGFQNVQSMTGGIDQWAQEIEPGMVRY